MNYLKELFTALAGMVVVVGGIYAITVWSVAKAESIKENTKSINALRIEVSENTEATHSLQQNLESLQQDVEKGFAAVDEDFKSIMESVEEIKTLLTNGKAAGTAI